jgi:hypothetical protein
VDVCVDGSGGGDQPFAGDDGRARADHDVDAVEGVGVPGPADGTDPPLADADGDLPDSLCRVDHHHIADDDVTGLTDGRGLEVQPVARGLAEPGEELVAVLLGVGLDSDREPRVAEADAVAGPGAVGGCVLVRIHRVAPRP